MPRGTQTIKSVEYVFETNAKWNADKKFGTHTRTYIGKMVDGVLIPNKKYQMQQALEAALRVEPVQESRPLVHRNLYGATFLFDEIGRKLGISDDLKTCFQETWKQLLSIAYSLILEDRNPLSRFPRWATNHRHPFAAPIPS